MLMVQFSDQSEGVSMAPKPFPLFLASQRTARARNQ
jgi:hypothetical protein